jgi:hypothetical protein
MADQKELFFNEGQFEYAMRRNNETVKSQIWTSLPCKIVSYNPQEQSCVVQPLIQGKFKQPDGTWIDGDYPPVKDVPVRFVGGGGYSITHPVKVGDEGTIEFQARCIDNWWLNMGTSMGADGKPAPSPTGSKPQAEMRMHDRNDGVFKSGVRSKQNWLQNVSTDSVQIRSDDGKTVIDIANGKITITATTVKINGELQVTGKVTAGFGTGDSVTVQQHTHNQANDSHGDSEQPTNPPNAGT